MIFDRIQKGQLDWDLIDQVWNDVAIVISNPELQDCPIVFANDKFLEHSGYTEQEVLGRNCRFMQGPETEQDAIALFRKIIQERRTETVVVTNYKKDGTKFRNKVLLTAVKDRKGENCLIVAVQQKLVTH